MSTTLRKQNVIIMLLIALLIFASYYYIYAMPIDTLREIRIISNSALLGLCLFGSVFLLSDPQSTRLRKIFALQILMVALASTFSLMRIITQNDVMIISPGMLIYDNVYAFILLAYPFELLCPNQKRYWRYVRMVIIVFLTIAIYSVYIHLSGLQINEADNLQKLWANFHKFDIWFRLIIFVYLVLMLLVIMRQKRPDGTPSRRESSSAGSIDLGRLNYYLIGYFLIFISYMTIMLLLNYQSIIMHSLAFVMLFGFTFYNIRQQRVPVLAGDMKVINWADTEYEYVRENPLFTTEYNTKDKYRFVDKISQYKSDLDRWMYEQKPYRNKDFKLVDVMQVLPLNRSYISQLFNEGYGETFFNFVMRYRIEESVCLLENHPEMNIRCISDMCGFSSPSVFGRAFLKNKGVTPKQYREDIAV